MKNRLLSLALLLSLAFLSVAAGASAAAPEAWPDNPVTVTDANAVQDMAMQEFQAHPAVQLQATAPEPVTLYCSQPRRPHAQTRSIAQRSMTGPAVSVDGSTRWRA